MKEKTMKCCRGKRVSGKCHVYSISQSEDMTCEQKNKNTGFNRVNFVSE